MEKVTAINISAASKLDEAEEIVDVDSRWKTITYICSSCKAIDHDNVYGDNTIIPVINCWKCGNGRGLEQQQMLMQRRGMFPQLHN